ncbi:hypothetical protein Tco_0740334, partial [Tanacetum coccineum]
VWKSVRYGISKGLDSAYWSFLEQGPRLISSRILYPFHISNTAYWSSLDTAYWALSFVVFGECRHEYAVSS